MGLCGGPDQSTLEVKGPFAIRMRAGTDKQHCYVKGPPCMCQGNDSAVALYILRKRILI